MRLITDFSESFRALHATFIKHSRGISLASEICPKLVSFGADLARLSAHTFCSDEDVDEAMSQLAHNLGAGMVAVEFVADDNHPQFVDTQTFDFR